MQGREGRQIMGGCGTEGGIEGKERRSSIHKRK